MGSDLEYMRTLAMAREALGREPYDMRWWRNLRPSENVEDRRDPTDLGRYTPSQWASNLERGGARPALPDTVGVPYDPSNEDARDMVGPRYGSGQYGRPDPVAVALNQMRRSQPRGFASGGPAFNGLSDMTTGLADRSADTALATALAEVNAAREAQGLAPISGPTANNAWSPPLSDSWTGPPTFTSQDAFDAAWSPLASDFSTDTAYTNAASGSAPTAYGAASAAPAFSADTYSTAGNIPGTGFVTGGSFGTPPAVDDGMNDIAFSGQSVVNNAGVGLIPGTAVNDLGGYTTTAATSPVAGLTATSPFAAASAAPAAAPAAVAAPAAAAAAPSAGSGYGGWSDAGLGLAPGTLAAASGDIPSFSTTDGFGYSAGTNGGYSGTYSASDVGSGSELATAGSDWGGSGGGDWGGGAGGGDAGGSGGGGDGSDGGGGGGDRGGDSGGNNASGGRILDHALRLAEHYARGGGLGLINPIARAMRPGGRPGYESGGEIDPGVAAGMARGWDWSQQPSAGAPGAGGGATTPVTTPATGTPAPGGGRYTTGALKIWMPELTGTSTTAQPTATYQPVNTNPDLRIWSALAAAGFNPPAFNLPYGGTPQGTAPSMFSPFGGPYGQ